jgi:hypothetical protein
VEEKAPAKDDCGDDTVQDERTGEVAAKVVTAGVVFSIELGVSGYGTLLTSAAAE